MDTGWVDEEGTEKTDFFFFEAKPNHSVVRPNSGRTLFSQKQKGAQKQ